MLLDSNIIIYSVLPEHGALRRLISAHEPAVSAISYVEVLGYHELTDRQIRSFEGFLLHSLFFRLPRTSSTWPLDCASSTG